MNELVMDGLGWNRPTQVMRQVDRFDLSGIALRPRRPIRDSDAPTWITREGDTVTVGDRVAIYSLEYRHAVGDIIGGFLGRIDFRITAMDDESCQRRVFVDEEQLLTRIPRDSGRT